MTYIPKNSIINQAIDPDMVLERSSDQEWENLAGKFFKDENKSVKVSPVQAAKLLIRDTEISGLHCYRDLNTYLYFDPKAQKYTWLSQHGALNLLSKVIGRFQNTEIQDYSFLDKILNNLSTLGQYRPGHPQQSPYLVGFKNGVFCTRSGKFYPPTSKLLTLSNLPFNYKGSGPTPNFDKFLNETCSGMMDKMDLVRAILKLAIKPNPGLQKFFYFYGEAGTGKSTIGNILRAMVSEKECLSTTLQLLEYNTFESSNLRGKKVVLVSDPGRFKGAYATLKALTRGVTPLRVKFQRSSRRLWISSTMSRFYDEQLSL